MIFQVPTRKKLYSGGLSQPTAPAAREGARLVRIPVTSHEIPPSTHVALLPFFAERKFLRTADGFTEDDYTRGPPASVQSEEAS